MTETAPTYRVDLFGELPDAAERLADRVVARLIVEHGGGVCGDGDPGRNIGTAGAGACVGDERGVAMSVPMKPRLPGDWGARALQRWHWIGNGNALTMTMTIPGRKVLLEHLLAGGNDPGISLVCVLPDRATGACWLGGR